MLKNLKIRIANKLLAYLFNATHENAFMRITPIKGSGTRVHGVIDMIDENGKAERLSESVVLNLAAEAHAIKRMQLYSYLFGSMKHTARDAIFNKSKNADDLLFPKAVLYTIDVLEKKIKSIIDLA